MAQLTALQPQQPNASGETRYGLAYYRVSTAEQANTSYDDDGFSIQAQREYCQRKAADMGVTLVDEYVDRGKSARTADRPALQAMFRRIKEDTDIQFIFVHKLDRLARSRQDDVQIGLLLAKNGVRLVSCTENIDDTPSGQLVRGIMADIAEWYSANLSDEAKKGMRKKAEIGGTPGKAPVGYVNTRLKVTELGKDIGIVNVDDVNGPIITECFRHYDSGHCSLEDVAAYANDQGFRMPANKRLPERPVTAQQMNWILRNCYYMGVVSFGGVEYKGEHQPLIDEATFARVQALLTARDLNKDKSRKRPHHLKGMIFCAYCGRRLGICVPTRHETGISHAYFYCLGRQKDRNSCPLPYLKVVDVEVAIHDFWERVHIPLERASALRRIILASFEGKYEEGQVEIGRQKRRIIDLEQRQRKAKAAYYAGVLDLEEFRAEQESIKQNLAGAQEIIDHFSVELDGIALSLDEALKLLETPQALYDAMPDGLKLLMMQAVFAKVWVVETGVVGSELAQPFLDLFTLDARLAWDEQRRSGDLSSETTTDPEGTTYFRTRSSGLSREYLLDGPTQRPDIERPFGRLAIDREDGDPPVYSCSKIGTLVGVIRYKLNEQLARFIREHPQLGELPNEGP